MQSFCIDSKKLFFVARIASVPGSAMLQAERPDSPVARTVFKMKLRLFLGLDKIALVRDLEKPVKNYSEEDESSESNFDTMFETGLTGFHEDENRESANDTGSHWARVLEDSFLLKSTRGLKLLLQL